MHAELDSISSMTWDFGPDEKRHTVQHESLILAQSERWRRGLGMQVERESGLRPTIRAAKG